MSVVSCFLALAGVHVASAGWVPVGPERGHVLDAAVGAEQVSVATRVGVLSSDLGLEEWQRDDRFPPEVRRLVYGPDQQVYAAPAGSIWRVGASTELLHFYESRSTPVDLAVTGSGVLLAAVRGEESGVLRFDGEPQRLLPQLDPWRLAAQGERVLLGTIDAGVHLSEDGGATWQRVLDTDQGVSAVGWAGEQAWVGLADGSLMFGPPGQWRSLDPVNGGYATHFAALPAGVLICVDRSDGRNDGLLIHDGVALRKAKLRRVDDDPSTLDLTGAWALPDGAMVGSFRRGPLHFDGARLRPRRQGFRATVTGGAVLDDAGRLVLALMGTGVYLSADSGESWYTSAGAGQPVTDSVAVVAHGTGALVVDFEGITLLDADGVWQRLPRLEQVGAHGGENLVTAAYDAQDRLWAVDRKGGLYLLEGERWASCRQRGLRLDGAGEHLLLATPTGFVYPDSCEESWRPLRLDGEKRMDAMHARAAGGWVAGYGSVWHGSKKVFAITPGSVTALAVRERELLVGLDQGVVVHCGERCVRLDDEVPGIPEALGWLPDGRIWVAERSGTLLIQGQAPELASWTSKPEARRVTGDLMSLERAPWDAQAGPVQPGGQVIHQGPGPQGPPDPGLAPAAPVTPRPAEPELEDTGYEQGFLADLGCDLAYYAWSALVLVVLALVGQLFRRRR